MYRYLLSNAGQYYNVVIHTVTLYELMVVNNWFIIMVS